MPSTPARPAPPKHNGDAIKTIRTLRGLSRTDLGERVGATYSHIANLELEFKSASPELIHRIATALDVPVAALLRQPMSAQRGAA
jgi:transcriptional regulator with XRE-family HTH domain